MTIDELIELEVKLYLERYQAWQDSKECDDTAKLMASESERILRQLYRLKYNPKDERAEMIGYSNFMADLGSRFKL